MDVLAFVWSKVRLLVVRGLYRQSSIHARGGATALIIAMMPARIASGRSGPGIPVSEWNSGVRAEWHSVKLNTLGFKVLRRKTPAHRLIINNMIFISLDPKPNVSEAYSMCYIRTNVDLC